MTDDQTRPEDRLRARAITRLKKKRDFHAHLLIYVLVNSFLIVLWAMTSRNAFFWPVFPLVGWGIAVVMNAWDVYRGGDFSEDQIDAEVRRLEDH